eukprot:6321990-Prymnesium_polylepis.2
MCALHKLPTVADEFAEALEGIRVDTLRTLIGVAAAFREAHVGTWNGIAWRGRRPILRHRVG